MRAFISLLMLCVCIGAQEISDVDPVNASAPCPHRVIKSLGSCCALPTFIPAEVMQACFTSECSGFIGRVGRNGFSFMGWRTLFSEPGVLFPRINIPDTSMLGESPQINFRGGLPEIGSGFPLMGGGFPGRRGGSYPSPETPTQEKDAEWVPRSALQGSKRNKGGRKGPNIYSRKKRHHGGGGRGTFMCSMECIFRNLTLLTNEGGVDTTAVSTRFSSINNATWQPIVAAALTECTAQLAKANLSAIPTSPYGGKACNPGPALYMACVRRYLALNCPDTYVPENNGLSEACAGQMTALKNCNPFAVAQCNRQGGWRRGGGGSWGGGRGGGDSWGRGGGGGDVEVLDRPEKNRRHGDMRGRRG